MRGVRVCFLALAIILNCNVAARKCKLNVMSFNMLFEHVKPAQEERQWVNRLPNAVEFFSQYRPDVVGTQELQTFQVREFVAQSGYGWVGGSLSRGNREGDKSENEAIFYRKDKLEVLDEGNIWFSETPDKPGSFSWGMKYPRMCTWAKFRERSSGKVFYVLNSHFYVDADKEDARLEAARIVMDKVREALKDAPVICTGDFNGLVENASIQYLLRDGVLKDARVMVKKPEGPEGSFHGFRRNFVPSRRIDHIFVSDNVKVKSYRIIDDQIKTYRYISDHLPVSVFLEF